jgi:hypothetical protein
MNQLFESKIFQGSRLIIISPSRAHKKTRSGLFSGSGVWVRKNVTREERF